MLEIIDLVKEYEGGILAVDHLNLTVRPGELFSMLGANGAGKTSTVMMCLGFTEPTSGSVRVCGVDVAKDPLEAKKHMAYVSENVMLYGNFNAIQNAEFFSRLAGKKHTRDHISNVLYRTGLAKEAQMRRVKTFSKGMRQRVGIAIAMLKEAAVILMDEPTSGLDPAGGDEFIRLMLELRDEGKAIMMVTHDIFRVKDCSDNIGIMAAGNFVMRMSREEFLHADLNELYLRYIHSAVTHGKTVSAKS